MGSRTEALTQEVQAIQRLQGLLPIHEQRLKVPFRRPEQRLPTNNRELAQRLEIAHIVSDADAIEGFFTQHHLPLPSVYAIFTAGFEPPQDAETIGQAGKDIFKNIPAPEIPGHSGNISLLPIGKKGQSMMIFQGRAHPYEWSTDPNGAMIAAHQLQVLKELARRQRTNGVDPLFILTYLTGVRENQTLHPGDLGVILDDSEGTNNLHPGHGPRGILNYFVGDQFQAKMGRSTDPELARRFVSSVNKNINIGPAIVVGTDGTTEYQSNYEVAAADAAYNGARTQVDDLAREIFDTRYDDTISLFFGMGPTFELATLRQTLPGERSFRLLPLVLATDQVGGTQSEDIDHAEVVSKAFEAGSTHRDSIVKFVRSTRARGLIKTTDRTDYSIRTKLENA